MKSYSQDIIEAIDNTPGAELLPNNDIKLQVCRYQKPEQSGDWSARTGVFYYPELNPVYGNRLTKGYGGSQRITGTITVKRPYIARAGVGGKGPEKAFTDLYGKNSYEELWSDYMKQVSNKKNFYEKEEGITNLLDKWGGNPDIAYNILTTSTDRESNQLRYAIFEHIYAHKLRDKGYDSVLSYSIQKGRLRLVELYDLRQDTYPEESGFHYEHMVTSFKLFCKLF